MFFSSLMVFSVLYIVCILGFYFILVAFLPDMLAKLDNKVNAYYLMVALVSFTFALLALDNDHIKFNNKGETNES